MTQSSEEREYRVSLDVYSGPLELLLYLIKRNEVDIKDIPIAKITEQYLAHVDIIRRIDINLAGEFLVMAATLMEIKSRMLIPRIATQQNANGESSEGTENAPTSVEDFADPRAELVRQLLAYKQYKDAGDELKRKAVTEAMRYPRGTPKARGTTPLDIEDLNLFGLIDAFNAIMSSIGHSAYGHEVVYDDTPITLHQADIIDRLMRLKNDEGRGALTLHQLFVGRKNKSEMIGLFLATLELIRQKKVLVQQAEPGADIEIILREDDPDQILFKDGGTTEVAAPQAAGVASAVTAATADSSNNDAPNHAQEESEFPDETVASTSAIAPSHEDEDEDTEENESSDEDDEPDDDSDEEDDDEYDDSDDDDEEEDDFDDDDTDEEESDDEDPDDENEDSDDDEQYDDDEDSEEEDADSSDDSNNGNPKKYE